jgi:hypothetical protein
VQEPSIWCVSVPACDLDVWWWRLLAGGTAEEAVHVAFDLTTRGDTLELGGELRLDADCDATMRWSITARPTGIVEAELSTGTLAPGNRQPLYAPLHRDIRTVTLTAHRSDSHLCTVMLVWQKPDPIGLYWPTSRPEAPPASGSR